MRNKNHRKSCVFCGIEFYTHKPKSILCSHSCAAKRKHSINPQTGSKNPNYKGESALSKYQRKLKWRKANPEKAFAHDVFSAAIRAKKLIRMPCEVCGDKNSDGHHIDYSKPLEVIWLCRKHHNQINGKSCRAQQLSRLRFSPRIHEVILDFDRG